MVVLKAHYFVLPQIYHSEEKSFIYNVEMNNATFYSLFHTLSSVNVVWSLGRRPNPHVTNCNWLDQPMIIPNLGDQATL